MNIIRNFQRPKITRLIKFAAVGGTGLIINSALLAFFTEITNLHYLFSAFLATQGSTFWNFSITDRWVFRGGDKKQTYVMRFVAFLLMNNLALLARGPLLAFLTAGLEVHYLLSNLISLGMITILRYAISANWIWRDQTGQSNRKIYYDIHSVVQIESFTRLPELEAFQVNVPIANPDLRLQMGTVQDESAKILSGIHYDEGLGDHGFWLHVTQGSTTEIRVSPLLEKSPHVLYTNVIEPILRWTLVRKGYALVHSACLSHSGQGILITAKTDTGKTTTILKTLSNYPFAFLSDDMIILGPDGTLLSFPKPLTISRHTLQAVNSDTLLFREKFALQIQSRIHSRSGRWIGLLIAKLRLPAATLNTLVQMLIPPPKYNVERLIPNVQFRNQAKLSYVVLIERGAPTEDILTEMMMAKIIIRNSEDAYGFPPYPQLALELRGWEGEDLQDLEELIVRKALSAIPAVLLRRSDYEWWSRIPAVYYGMTFQNIENPISTKYPTVPRSSMRDKAI